MRPKHKVHMQAYIPRSGKYYGPLGVYFDTRRKAAVSRLRRPLFIVLAIALGLWLLFHHVWAAGVVFVPFSGKI